MLSYPSAFTFLSANQLLLVLVCSNVRTSIIVWSPSHPPPFLFPFFFVAASFTAPLALQLLPRFALLPLPLPPGFNTSDFFIKHGGQNANLHPLSTANALLQQSTLKPFFHCTTGFKILLKSATVTDLFPLPPASTLFWWLFVRSRAIIIIPLWETSVWGNRIMQDQRMKLTVFALISKKSKQHDGATSANYTPSPANLCANDAITPTNTPCFSVIAVASSRISKMTWIKIK